jgi:hypothetical protein
MFPLHNTLQSLPPALQQGSGQPEVVPEHMGLLQVHDLSVVVEPSLQVIQKSPPL